MEIGEIVKGNVNMDERKVIVMKWREMEQEEGRKEVWRVDREKNVEKIVKIKVMEYEKERVIVERGINKGEIIVKKGEKMMR